MKALLFVLLLTSSLTAVAEYKSESVCSQNSKVCVTYKTDAPFTTSQEARFQLFLESSDQKEIVFVKADLWMQMGHHGHGSAPLGITRIAPGHFDVVNAYFVMLGTWQIRVTYKQEDRQETLVIPVLISE